MKFQKYFLFFFLSCSLNVVYGHSESDSLISRFKPGFMWFYTGIRPATPEKVRKYDRFVIDFTHSSLNGDVNSAVKGLSFGMNTNLLFDFPLTKGNTISFGTGICYSFFHVRHDNLFLTNSTTNTTIYQLKDTLDSFSRSVLGGNNIGIPLELRFRSKGWKHVKFHIGGKIGYQANLFNKYIIHQEKDYKKIKSFYFLDINHLTYSIHARFGIRNWSLFVSYYFSPTFANSKSVKINLLQFGVSLSVF
ncbi:MAG: hypothetical protein HYR91_02820 [Flavobacteriia bacterium]|nr:hypothetical protein [Flavobacteriia bacterium]